MKVLLYTEFEKKISEIAKSNVNTNEFDMEICDTDFHQLRMTDTNIDLPAYAPIKIEKNCWLAQNCIVQKGTMLPSYCIAATNSLLNKKYEIPNYSLIAGQPATLKKCNIYRDPKKDNVIYQSIENI